VRELRNVLEQAVLLHRGQTIEAEHLALAKTEQPTGPGATADDAATLPEIERQALLQVQRHGWNVTRAARALGISRDTLRYRIEKFNLSASAS
jgi:two-component system, NtrC family, response regulator AtoC